MQHEFRPYINGKISGFPGSQAEKLPNGKKHPFWIISNNFYFNPAPFTSNEEGKGWLNEVEGLIHQKCPEADLRIENVLTNELFAERHETRIEDTLKPKRLKRTGGMREMLKK